MMMIIIIINSMGLGDALVEQIVRRDGCKLKCAKLTCQIVGSRDFINTCRTT
jgi:hypothetical protein